ncbi:ABC transporter permease, partial [Amylibacter sp.]|nr:ABC transporter permease [Amylibacter sp.]
MDISVVSLIASLIVASTPILLAATGELIVEKSGVLNLGVEGMMIMGAICGFIAAVNSGSP